MSTLEASWPLKRAWGSAGGPGSCAQATPSGAHYSIYRGLGRLARPVASSARPWPPAAAPRQPPRPPALGTSDTALAAPSPKQGRGNVSIYGAGPRGLPPLPCGAARRLAPSSGGCGRFASASACTASSGASTCSLSSAGCDENASAAIMKTEYEVATPDGIKLVLVRGRALGGAAPPRQHPVLMVPGLASSADASFDPAPGRSLFEHLAKQGYDVWRVDLRGELRYKQTVSYLHDPIRHASLPSTPAVKGMQAAFSCRLQARGAPCSCHLSAWPHANSSGERPPCSVFSLAATVAVSFTPLAGNGRSDAPNASYAAPGWNVDDHLFVDLPAVMKLILEETGAQQLHWIGGWRAVGRCLCTAKCPQHT